MVRSSFGPNELSFVAVKACRSWGQFANLQFDQFQVPIFIHIQFGKTRFDLH